MIFISIFFTIIFKYNHFLIKCFNSIFKFTTWTNITVKSHLNIHQPRLDGLCGLYLRITIDRKSKYISLRKYCNPDHFDFESKRVKVCLEEPNAKMINRFLKDEESRAENIILELQRTGQPVVFTTIISLF